MKKTWVLIGVRNMDPTILGLFGQGWFLHYARPKGIKKTGIFDSGTTGLCELQGLKGGYMGQLNLNP